MSTPLDRLVSIIIHTSWKPPTITKLRRVCNAIPKITHNVVFHPNTDQRPKVTGSRSPEMETMKTGYGSLLTQHAFLVTLWSSEYHLMLSVSVEIKNSLFQLRLMYGPYSYVFHCRVENRILQGPFLQGWSKGKHWCFKQQRTAPPIQSLLVVHGYGLRRRLFWKLCVGTFLSTKHIHPVSKSMHINEQTGKLGYELTLTAQTTVSHMIQVTIFPVVQCIKLYIDCNEPLFIKEHQVRLKGNSFWLEKTGFDWHVVHWHHSWFNPRTDWKH